jgi:hypothetical protein
MADRPILFSAPMVRAILAGTKTQTRRVVKTVGRDGGFVIVEEGDGSWWPRRSDDGESCFVTVRDRGGHYLHEIPMTCPYGVPGDRLWVREAWRGSATLDWAKPSDMPAGSAIFYEADDRSTWCDDLTHPPSTLKRPGMFMPRWASRITLEVTGVRVERLQDISDADALAEGIDRHEVLTDGDAPPGFHRETYQKLWERINGPGSWAANPWVWVVEFKRA